MGEAQSLDLQIDHPEVDDLQEGFQPGSLKAHVTALIHRWPYEQLRTEAAGKQVMELGCNKGFGTVIYSGYAASVKAVDTSIEAIAKAASINARDNVEYRHLDSWTLPFETDAFDLTVLFQVIEHIALDKLDIFIREIRRVTRPRGKVILSTPNRKIRLLPFQQPWNPFHTREYSARELETLLGRYFAEVRVEGLFGNESLNAIERRRVRQKPGNVYVKRPLRRLLELPMLRWVPRRRGASSRRRSGSRRPTGAVRGPTAVAGQTAPYPFTTSDLGLRGESLDRALDLIATVTRVK